MFSSSAKGVLFRNHGYDRLENSDYNQPLDSVRPLPLQSSLLVQRSFHVVAFFFAPFAVQDFSLMPPTAHKNCAHLSQVNRVCGYGQLLLCADPLTSVHHTRRTDRKQFPLED